MKTVIVFDHPYTAAASENVPHHRAYLAAVCKRVITQLKDQGDTVDLIDLHADGFNPVMSADDLTAWRLSKPMNEQVADYQRRLAAADRIVFIFPIWWDMTPAMTKGFLEKVYAKNIMYSAKNMKTKLHGPRIDVVTTMTTPTWIYKWILGAPMVKMMHRGIVLKTRIGSFHWHNIDRVDKVSAAKRSQRLKQFKI